MRNKITIIYAICILLLGVECKKNIQTADFSFISCKYSSSVVSFTNKSINATSYEWDFGDGSAKSTEPNPKHLFTKNSKVTLTTNGADGTKTISKDISFIERPDYCTLTSVNLNDICSIGDSIGIEILDYGSALLYTSKLIKIGVSSTTYRFDNINLKINSGIKNHAHFLRVYFYNRKVRYGIFGNYMTPSKDCNNSFLKTFIINGGGPIATCNITY